VVRIHVSSKGRRCKAHRTHVVPARLSRSTVAVCDSRDSRGGMGGYLYVPLATGVRPGS
jgi:hypothetical protein